MKNPIDEFSLIIDEIYGLFLDSTQGFHHNIEELTKLQFRSINVLKKSIAEQDKGIMTYGKGDPDEKDSLVLHRCTQGELKERNEKNGQNTAIIGNLCLCQIYNYWEDHYRNEIAEYLGIKKNELVSDILGEMRVYRHSIIHKRGLGKQEIEKCQILNWFKMDELIKIDEHKFEIIVTQLYKYLRGIKSS